MGTSTGIEWTDATWNPVTGCSRVSEGCRHCYAERFAHRFSGEGQRYEGLTVLANGHPSWTGKIKFDEKALLAPLKWKKPRRVFVNSMSDLFHEGVTDEMRDKIFAVMALTPHHTYQVLTKRPDIMLRYMTEACTEAGGLRIGRAAAGLFHGMGSRDRCLSMAEQAAVSNQFEWQELEHVWLGVSAEDQDTFKERLRYLAATPAALRFISFEPLLGPIDTHIVIQPAGWKATSNALAGIGWAIVGGESGPGARPFHTEWASSLVKQFGAAGRPIFVKQLGSCVIQAGERRRKRDRKGGDMHEWPHEIRVRQFPAVPPCQ